MPLATAALLLYGGWRVLEGQLTLGDLVQFDLLRIVLLQGVYIDLVINATPVGTAAVGGMLPFDWELLSPDATVVDANLEETDPALLHEAAERELATVNGLDIFLEQAAMNFRMWTDMDPDRTVMREAVEEYLEL